MLRADIKASAPRGDVTTTWFGLLVKFPSPVMFAIVLDCSEN